MGSLILVGKSGMRSPCWRLADEAWQVQGKEAGQGSGGGCWQGGGGRGEAASCLERQVILFFCNSIAALSRMPPPDAETVQLRSQLESLVGKLKAKQEEVRPSSAY